MANPIPCPLTHRQVEVLRLLTTGLTIAGAATHLERSTIAVQHMLRRARDRAGTLTTYELVAVAVRERWIP